MKSNVQQTPPILVDAREAARLLSLSDRSLFELTVPRGPIPRVVVGAKRLFRVADLQEFAASRVERPQESAKTL